MFGAAGAKMPVPSDARQTADAMHAVSSAPARRSLTPGR